MQRALQTVLTLIRQLRIRIRIRIVYWWNAETTITHQESLLTITPLGAVWSGSPLFAQTYLSENHYCTAFLSGRWKDDLKAYIYKFIKTIWAPSSKCVSLSIPTWQILTVHAQPFRGARDLAFCLKVPLDSLLVWASSGGSGETVRMRRLAWTFAARIGDKYQIPLTRSICPHHKENLNKGCEPKWGKWLITYICPI